MPHCWELGTTVVAMRMGPEIHLRFLNSRLAFAFVLLTPWLAIRNRVSWLDSPVGVLVEWTALMGLAFLCGQVRQAPRWVESSSQLFLIIVISLSILNRFSFPLFPMYWNGFGPTVLACSLIIGVAMCVTTALVDAGYVRGEQLVDSGILNRAARWLGIVVSASLIPSILQPMDAWLNVGDATQIVLEELSGWAIGHAPGVQQAAGYGSLIGLPLIVLQFFHSGGPYKLTAVVLWANTLVIMVPIVIAAIFRGMFRRMSFGAAFAIALVSVTVSGEPYGENFSFNTSLFRELSAVSRLLPPLVLLYLLIRLLRKQLETTAQLVMLGVAAGLVSLNNFEFGFGAAAASIVAILVAQLHRGGILRSTWIWLLTVLATWTLALAPVAFFAESAIRRRLGAFNAVVNSETDLFQDGHGATIPVFGLVGLVFAVAVAAVGISSAKLANSGESESDRVAAVVTLYTSLWTIFSAPYVLNRDSPGPLIYFVLLVLMVAGLLKLLLSGRLCAIGGTQLHEERTGGQNFRSAFSLFPLFLLLGLVLSAVIQAPAPHREWRRIQTPISEQKWVDEWSAEKLDWIEVSRVESLAAQFGGASEVGWWFQHGSAVEILTGVENLLGIPAYEGVRSDSMLKLACEPLAASSKRFVIALISAQATLERCPGISARSLTQDDAIGMAVFEVSRNR